MFRLNSEVILYILSFDVYSCMAFEPFNETLETWLERRDRKQLDCETETDILRQITKGLMHYHTNKLTHGNLSLSQIVIFEKESTIVAKVATLALSPGRVYFIWVKQFLKVALTFVFCSF